MKKSLQEQLNELFVMGEDELKAHVKSLTVEKRNKFKDLMGLDSKTSQKRMCAEILEIGRFLRIAKSNVYIILK